VIDVVIPVYKGNRETRRCVDSVLSSIPHERVEVVVVDDASPEPEIVGYLDELARGRRITLLRNETNVGFVGSVNRAMALHRDRDVVLLNSDTEVANDWLDRLRRCAGADPDVGTVTPFSNNATICSYPFEGWAAGVPGYLRTTSSSVLRASPLRLMSDSEKPSLTMASGALREFGQSVVTFWNAAMAFWYSLFT